jgi:competence protein ComEC
MNYRNTPFLRIILPFSIGIILGDSLPHPYENQEIVSLLILAFLSLLSAGWKYAYPYRWIFGSIIQITLVFMGYWYTGRHNELSQKDHFSSSILPDSLSVLDGIVTEMPVPGEKYKIQIAVENIRSGQNKPRCCSGNILLFISEDTTGNAIQYGDRVRVQARISPVKPPANPDAFDYRNYLHHHNIHYNAYTKRKNITITASGKGNPIWEKAFAYRTRLLALLQQYFPGQDEYAVASALLVGYTEDLSDEIKTAYAETGSMHALAVSGTHVGLLYIGLLFLLQRLPFHGRQGRLMETTLALLAIWAFTFLTGATASVLRASVMFSTHLVGKMVFRQANIWNVLSASAFGLLVYNPYFLFDAGFLLSYAAVVGMAFFYPLLYKISPLMKYKWMDEGWKVLLVGISAQIGTLPLSLYYFHQFPCYFWLSGWVVVLGGAVFLWAGALLIVLDMTLPFLAGWLGYGLNGMLWAMNKIIAGIQHLPGSVITGVWISTGGAIILYGVIAAVGVAIVLKKTKALILALCGITFLLMAGAFRNMGQTHQKEICIYSAGKGRLIDIFDGHKRVTFAENLTPRQENFAAQSHRWAMGVEHTKGDGISFEKDTTVLGIMYIDHVINFSRINIAIIDNQASLDSRNTIQPVTALMLSHNPAVSLIDCFEKYPCSLVIIDPTNSWKLTQRWKEEGEALGLEIWDMREKGAWRWTQE